MLAIKGRSNSANLLQTQLVVHNRWTTFIAKLRGCSYCYTEWHVDLQYLHAHFQGYTTQINVAA